MKDVSIPIAGLTIHQGKSVYESEPYRHCCRCTKRIENADDDRTDGERVVCFWCAFVDTQG